MQDTDFERAMDETIAKMKPAGPPRDPKRIPHILARLQAIWEQNPDARLGQLVAIATSDANPPTGSDPFYTEDEPLIAALEKRYPAPETDTLPQPSPARVTRVIDGLGLCWEEEGYSEPAAAKLLAEATQYAHIARGGTCTACANNEKAKQKFYESEEALEKMGFVGKIRPA